MVTLTANGIKRYRELDVWIPELKLGFEYQVCTICSCLVLVAVVAVIVNRRRRRR